MDFYERIAAINLYVQEWMINNDRNEAIPGEIMEFLISKNVYAHDHREGGPIRNDLRRLRAEGNLALISGLELIEAGDNYTRWYFKRVPLAD
jgi:hypothetical protein